MSESKSKGEHASHEPNKAGCCGGAHAKDQKAHATQKPQAPKSAEQAHEHGQKTGGCCGDGKASK